MKYILVILAFYGGDLTYKNVKGVATVESREACFTARDEAHKIAADNGLVVIGICTSQPDPSVVPKRAPGYEASPEPEDWANGDWLIKLPFFRKHP